MKTKASVLTLRLPFELKHKIEQIADEQGLSINQLALYTFTKEIEEMETYNYFEKYWKGKSKKKILNDFDNVLGKVKIRKTFDWDKL
jgi:predicted DNA-binding protein